MASGIYNRFKMDLMKKIHDLVNDTIKVALMNNSHVFTKTNTGWADVSANEASGSGYTAGGQALASKAVTQDDTDDEGVLDAADISWDPATITAYHAVLYNDTPTTPLADPLICSLDFGGAKQADNGPFTIQWDAEGILNLT